MAKRTPWNLLKDGYRKRLERAGITPEQHANGASLSKARGHQETPEHPGDAYSIQGRKRYRKYLESVGSLRKRIIQRKVDLFSARFKWHEDRAREYIMEGGTDIPKPGRKQLQAALDMTDDEIEETIANPDIEDEWKFLWYH